MYCKNCGVELEDDMPVCPLCGEPVNGSSPDTADSPAGNTGLRRRPDTERKRRKFTWEIVSIILGSGIAAACIVDLVISGSITWSEYTTAVGLLIFCYVSVFAFLSMSILAETGLGFFLASLCFLLLDVITGGITWSAGFAIPILLGVNAIVIIYMQVVRSARYKGINLIAYAFLGAALLCLCVDGVVSLFKRDEWRLNWSIIVAACVVPIVLVLLFVHFRLRKGRYLKRTFHI